MRTLGDNSTPEMAELTKEERNFVKKENNFSFNHKDKWGVTLLAMLFGFLGSTLAGFIVGWSLELAGVSVGLLVLLVACIAYEPIRVLYMGSCLFAIFLRTPEFMDEDKHFPKHKLFVEPKTFEGIQSSVKRYLQKMDGGKAMFATKDTFDGENDYIGSGGTGENQWRILSIKLVDMYANGAREDFPELCQVLDQTPEIISCVLSVLEPQCKIPMHVGYYKGLMRYMLPVIVPKDREKVWLTVNGLKYSWTEGKSVLWDDTYPHAVYNTTDEVRVLLYMDVLRSVDVPTIAQRLNHFMVTLFKLSGLAQAEIKKTEVKVSLKSKKDN